MLFIFIHKAIVNKKLLSLLHENIVTQVAVSE